MSTTEAIIMDINKRDSMCNPRGGMLEDTANVRQTSDLSNFSEQQFSDSSSNNGEMSRAQHTKTANNSPCEEEPAQFPKTESSPMILEGDIDNLGNSNGSSTAALAITSPNSKSALPQQVSMGKVNPNAALAKPARDDKDINIKKEDTALSPQNASPLGNNDDNGNDDVQERSKSVGSIMSTNIPSSLDAGNNSMSASPKSNCDGFNSASSMQNLPRTLNSYNGNPKFNFPPQGESQGAMNSPAGGGEYMQQQNHVFVFSTQLANKSAEAVVGGQFPTIIAYHCMQPSTKMFLEDFLKNPAKSSKMQRQYSLNIMNLMQTGSLNRPGAQSSFWLNECNNSGKMPQRQGTLRNVGAGVNKNSPGWEQTLGVLDTKGSSNPLDLLNNTEGFENAQQVCGIKDDDKSNIPSLQGVKVPDENLTPQQRQHREEQLAKLKKMNKFLFPENDGHDFHASQTNSSVSGEIPNSSAGSMEALHNSPSAVAGGNLSGNMGKHSVDNIPNLGDDAAGSGETSNMAIMQANKQGCMSKMNSNLSSIKSRGRNDETINTGIESSPDMTSSFNLNNCPPTDADAVRGPANMNIPHEEWSKFQNNAFGDSFKFRDSINNAGGLTGGSIPGHQNPSISRSHSTGVGGGYGIQSRPNTGPSPTNRNNNGPPPPYHQTQRSASVPISTQSPTQPSHNNSNTDMGIPSPLASRVPFGMSPTPPNVDVPNPAVSASNPPHSSAASFAGLPSGNNKNIYSRDGSNLVNTTQIYNSQCATGLNNMPNPPTSHSLSHMSHSEIDSLNSGHKLKRSSPQKSKSPMINEMQSNTGMGMESKYPNFGLNYGGMPPANAPNMRQNMPHMPPQFCRRIDSTNIPLNPNCNRVNQNKPVSNFDPIASLAQMSQQLTGSAMGLSTIGGGNNVSAGLMDVNTGDLMSGPSGRNEHPLDHCNQMSNNNMGMVGLGGRPGQFPSDMNSMDPMDQRMLNGKLCMPPGHFNHNALTGVGLGGNDMMPSNRSMRRMPGNFDNFNMSSNVHVRASAPNTIQYMPARSQNLNNMRVPPSMEFFQRYANPHGNMGGGVGNSAGHLNDMTNPNMMNMFGNCGQMPTGRGGGGFEQNDLGVDGNLIPNDGYMNGP